MYSTRKFLCVLFAVFVLFLFQDCRKENRRRVISDTDTTYSSDIRSVSKKINENTEIAELYYKRSNAFFFESKFKEAGTDIDYAIELDSTNALYYYKQGLYIMAADTADSKKAMNSYQTAISLKPDYTEAMLKLGILQIARQSYKEADATFRNMIKINGSDADAYFYMGISAKEQKDTVTAAALFEKTLQFDNNYYNAHMQLGNFYAVKGDPIAVKYYDNAMRINDFSDEAAYAKGLFMQNKNLYKDAMAMYTKTVMLNNGHKLAYYNSAYINSIFENYDKALEQAQKVEELDPGYSDAYALEGYILDKLRRKKESIEAFKKCLQLDPENSIAKAYMKNI